jgi:nickel-dependent lactate racemase
MKIALPYGDKKIEVNIKDENLLDIIEPVEYKKEDLPDIDELVENALDCPIGTGSLTSMVKGCRNVTIIADDNTRPTRADLILPYVIEQLNISGIENENITILIACGTHRPMTEEEIIKKVGGEIFRKVKVVNHLWKDKKNLEFMGNAPSGVPIEVNKLVTQADFCIGIGDIVPHPLAGWSGGGKIIEPGVCGGPTTCGIHGLMGYYPVLGFAGVISNPIRTEIDEIGKKAGLKFIINTVMDANENIVGIFAGDSITAHRKGVEFAKKIWTYQMKRYADIVLMSSYPADIDFWQAQKTLEFGEMIVKRGGDIILVTPCPEGLTGEEKHLKVLREYCKYPSKEIMRKAKENNEEDLAAILTSIHVALTRECANVIIVSDGIPKEDVLEIGLEHAESIEEALEISYKRQGCEAKIAVMTHGPKVIPVYE